MIDLARHLAGGTMTVRDLESGQILGRAQVVDVTAGPAQMGIRQSRMSEDRKHTDDPLHPKTA